MRLCGGLLAAAAAEWTAVGQEGKVTVEWTRGLCRAPVSVARAGLVVSRVPEEDPVKDGLFSKVLPCALGKVALVFFTP